MAHSITPCLYFGDENVLHKAVTMGNPVVCNIVPGTDQLEPQYDVNLSGSLVVVNLDGNELAANYLYDSFWGRYYFIRDRVSMPGGIMRLICEEDVLFSNASIIDDWQVFVIRTGSTSGYGLIPDSQYPVDPSRSYCEEVDFPSTPLLKGVTGQQYVLTLV